MTDFTATYLKGMYYDTDLDFFDQFIPCEICEQRAAEVHHIDARGMGGTTREYTVHDLMGLCRVCHEEYGDKKQYLPLLKTMHRLRVMLRRIHRIIQLIYPS